VERGLDAEGVGAQPQIPSSECLGQGRVPPGVRRHREEAPCIAVKAVCNTGTVFRRPWLHTNMQICKDHSVSYFI
jgi:hypothetical protein